MYFISVVIITAFREDDISAPVLYFIHNIQDGLQLCLHVCLVKPCPF